MFLKLLDRLVRSSFCEAIAVGSDGVSDSESILGNPYYKWKTPTNNIELLNNLLLLNGSFIPMIHTLNSDKLREMLSSVEFNSKTLKDHKFVFMILHMSSHLTKFAGTFSPIDFGIDLMITDCFYQDIDPVLFQEGFSFLKLLLQYHNFDMAVNYKVHHLFLTYISIKTGEGSIQLEQEVVQEILDNLEAESDTPNIRQYVIDGGRIKIEFSKHLEWLEFKQYLVRAKYDPRFVAMFIEVPKKINRKISPNYYKD